MGRRGEGGGGGRDMPKIKDLQGNMAETEDDCRRNSQQLDLVRATDEASRGFAPPCHAWLTIG